MKNDRLMVKQYTAKKFVEGEKVRWYQTKKGGETIYAVVTQVLGQTLAILRLGYIFERPVWDKLNSDQKIILDGLKELGIDYDPDSRKHAHDDNFCVQFHDGVPRLYIIDFDLARLAA
ncbi:hypothetical protein HYW99_03650 [Candidatus Woesearchaeota archaeon]|nr:hypothetical protein [Candidatus Woesearchaeota archaeon]